MVIQSKSSEQSLLIESNYQHIFLKMSVILIPSSNQYKNNNHYQQHQHANPEKRKPRESPLRFFAKLFVEIVSQEGSVSGVGFKNGIKCIA